MKVLLVGGTGVISTGVASEMLKRGMELWVLNRGKHLDLLPAGANLIIADYSDEEAVKALVPMRQQRRCSA